MKKCFCCELCAEALINAWSHLLCFVLGKILICLLLCFYNSLIFLCAISRQGWFCQGWQALSKTFCSAFGFSPQGLGGAERWKKGLSSASEKPLLDHLISALTVLPPSHLCAGAQHYTQNGVVIYNTLAWLQASQGFPLLRRPAKSFSSCSRKLPEQILISKEKARYGLGEGRRVVMELWDRREKN